MIAQILGLAAGAILALVPSWLTQTCPVSDSAQMDGGPCDPAAAVVTFTVEDPGTCNDPTDPCEWTYNVTIYNVNCTTECGGAFTCYRGLLKGTLGGFGNNDWTWSGEHVELSCTGRQSSQTMKYLVHCGSNDPSGTIKGGWDLTLICGACE